MNFIKNEHVKLDETCLNTQGHFKATNSNVMDVSPPHSTKHYILPIYAIKTSLMVL